MRDMMRKIEIPYLDKPLLIKQIPDGTKGKKYEYYQGRIYTHRTYDKKGIHNGYKINNEINNIFAIPSFLKNHSNYQAWLDIGALTDEGKEYFATPEGQKELKDLEEVIALAKSQG